MLRRFLSGRLSSVIAVAVVACSANGGERATVQESHATPTETATLQLNDGYRIIDISAHLVDGASGGESANVIDNPRANLWNVPQRRLRVRVTVASRGGSLAVGRMTLLAWEGDRTVFAESDTLVTTTTRDTSALEFEISHHFGCRWLTLRAYVSRVGPPDSEVWRVIPFGCGE
jgi:hypothetical protein